jgi:hypothetical protein
LVADHFVGANHLGEIAKGHCGSRHRQAIMAPAAPIVIVIGNPLLASVFELTGESKHNLIKH